MPGVPARDYRSNGTLQSFGRRRRRLRHHADMSHQMHSMGNPVGTQQLQRTTCPTESGVSSVAHTFADDLMSKYDKAQLVRAFARAGDGVFAVAGDGRIISWNRAAEKILGYRERDVVGRLCCDVLAGLDDKGNKLCYSGCQIVTLIKMGEAVQNFDLRVRSKLGKSLWINISILSIQDAGRNSPVTVHMFRDVSAAKELLTLVHDRLAARTPGENGVGVLTRREAEVLRLMATGLRTKAIGEALHVSPATVRNHAQNILHKLDVHSRLEAVACANKHQLL
jgi:PAS domain S-box-containing protein